MTGSDSERERARTYLDGSNWMQLAPTRDNRPRTTHLWFASDDELSLYVVSRYTRVHSTELMNNPHVAGGIALPPFDGLGTLGRGNHIQDRPHRVPHLRRDARRSRQRPPDPVTTNH